MVKQFDPLCNNHLHLLVKQLGKSSKHAFNCSQINIKNCLTTYWLLLRFHFRAIRSTFIAHQTLYTVKPELQTLAHLHQNTAAQPSLVVFFPRTFIGDVMVLMA